MLRRSRKRRTGDPDPESLFTDAERRTLGPARDRFVEQAHQQVNQAIDSLDHGGASPSGSTVSDVVDYFAGNAGDRSGVRLAAADLSGNGQADAVAGGGDGGSATAYSGTGTPELATLDPFPRFTGGVFVG